MRLRGGGNRTLPLVIAVAAFVVALVVIYFLFLAPRAV